MNPRQNIKAQQMRDFCQSLLTPVELCQTTLKQQVFNKNQTPSYFHCTQVLIQNVQLNGRTLKMKLRNVLKNKYWIFK